MSARPFPFLPSRHPVIKFRCVQCQKKVGVADSAAGKRAKCPVCEAVMRVPQPAREPVLAAAAEPEMRLAQDAPAPRPRRERRVAPQPGGGAADHTVAGQVVNAPSSGAFEPEAQLERRERADAMDSLAGLAALEEADGARLMSFGSSIGPVPRTRKVRKPSGRVPAAVRPACGTCGAETPVSARFCTSCGNPLGVPDLPVEAGTRLIALPMASPPRRPGWRDGFFGWLLGAR